MQSYIALCRLQISVMEERVVVSKDSDFVYSHVLHGRPSKLLVIKTGNISAQDLSALIGRHLPVIERVLQTHTLVEVDRSSVTLVI